MKKILFVTQVIDSEDPVLGFVCRWIDAFARDCEHVEVICLKYNKNHNYKFTNNVSIHSLGKENNKNKFKIYTKYITLIFKLRNNYDFVFAHMNPEYVIGGGIFWKIMSKRVLFWYAHGYVSLRLKMAIWLSDYILSSTEHGLGVETPKKRVVGQAIDTDSIKFENKNYNQKIEAVIWGRVSEVKNYETSIDAIKILRDRNIDIKLTIIGSPQNDRDIIYFERLQDIVRDMNLQKYINFVKAKAQKEIFADLKNYQLLISSSMTGSLDKVILEAMSAGVIPFTCNFATEKLYEKHSDILYYRQKDSEDLAIKIDKFLTLDTKDKESIARDLHLIVVKNHSLNTFVTRVKSVLK